MAEKTKKRTGANYLKSSTKVDLTGVMVLAFGISAVLGVGIYASLKYLKKNESHVSIDVAQDGIEQAIIRDKQVLAQKLPKNVQNMSYPSFESIKGNWKISFGSSGVAVIFLADNLFQLTVTTDPKGAVRQYSRGNLVYEQSTGKLSLIPSTDVGAPDPVKGVTYKVLTMRPYDIYISQEKRDPSLYFIAPQKDVAGKTYHPLFLQADYSGAPVLKWQRIQ